jgi:FG-GAP repeat/Secretion system C-terminal sorting domain
MKKRMIFILIIALVLSPLFSADWDMISKIVASDRSSDEYFGNDVAISGNFAIVGAYRENKSIDEGEVILNAGAAYIFRFDGSEWVQMQKLVASNRGEDYYFGYSVDICGNYAIVGAREEDVAGGHKEGAAYIFYYDGTSWAQQDRIYADDKKYGDYFGYSVALTENRAVIGAIYQDYAEAGSDSIGQAGAAYVFSRTGSSWSQTAKLSAEYRSEGDEFGSHVAMSGSNIVIGVPLEDMDADSLDYEMNAGAAYVFNYDGSHWSQAKKLLASDRNAYDQFGCSVDIDGSTIVVGAWMEDHDADGLNTKEKAGSAYIFDYAGTAWTETQKITDSYRWVGEYFGYDVAIENDFIIVGATQEYHDSSNANFVSDAGGAFIFKNTGGVWHESEKITAYVRSEDDHFGNSVDISADVVLVGASGEDHDAEEANTIYGAGSAYVFSTGIGGTVEPDIMVKGNDIEIVNGDSTPSFDDHTNFDTTQVTVGTLTRTFEIYNTGSGYLHIDSLYFEGFHAEDFSFVAPLPDSIAAGAQTALTISLTPSVVGRRNTVVHIISDDEDESPYTFDIMGAGKLPYSGGSGTELDPYLIMNYSDLIELSQSDFDWDKWFLQTRDIDMSATDSLNIEVIEGVPGAPTFHGFSPIGDSPTEGDRQQVPFSGVYDGGGHKISNLFIDRSSEHTVGLFGYVKDIAHTGHTAIRNVYLEDIFAIGSDYVGGLIGWNIDSWIDSCIVSGSVSTGSGTAGGLVGFDQEEIHNCHTMVYTTGEPAGGLVGYKEFGHIVNCSARDTVFSLMSSAGGLVGSMYQGDIANSFADAYVVGFAFTGGFVGKMTYRSKIENCYSKGKVAGQPETMWGSTGGFCGLVDGYGINLGSFIESSYSLTEVSILGGSTDVNRGFVGTATQTNTFSNNFFNVNTSGQLSDTSAAATPLDSSTMRDLGTYTNTITVGLDLAWDFVYHYYDDTGDEDLWDLDTSGTVNDGYPFLFWENPALVFLPEPEVSIAEQNNPYEYALLPAYPNPFNPRTTISYQMPDADDLKIRIFDINGKKITNLYSGDQEAGRYELTWDATNMPSGLYIVRMTAGDPETGSGHLFMTSQKIVLIK